MNDLREFVKMHHDMRALGTYVSRTVKLYTVYQLNRGRPVDGISFTTATTNERRPDPTGARSASCCGWHSDPQLFPKMK